MDVLFLSGTDVERLVDDRALLDALAAAFADLSAGRVTAPARNQLATADGSILLGMPGRRAGGDLAVKVVTLFEGNAGSRAAGPPRGACASSTPETGACRAFMDGTYVTAVRTAGAAALATRLLARPDARVLTILGAGVQGEHHLRTFPLVRDFAEIRIASSRDEDAERLAARDPRAVAVTDVEAAVRSSDVVALATNAAEPIVDPGWIAPGTHVSSVGYHPPRGELPTALLDRASLFVETRASTFEPPPVGCAELQGTDPQRATELGEVVAGTRPGRADDARDHRLQGDGPRHRGHRRRRAGPRGGGYGSGSVRPCGCSVGPMQAIVVTAHGGPDVLALQDVKAPAPGPGQVLVGVETAGVNYRDVYERVGGGYAPGTPPFVAGVEGAGTVQAVGRRRDRRRGRPHRVGRPGRAATPSRWSSTPARSWRCPRASATEDAAAVLLQGITAQYLATSTYPVAEGDTVVVHAAAGGVGLLLTQIVKLRGARVIATTSTPEKAALAREAGADEVIGYEELRDDTGAAVVFDGVGKATFDRSLGALRPRGMMVLYGAASGQPDPVAPAALAAKSLFLTRPGLGAYTADRAELLAPGRRRLRLDGRREARRADRRALRARGRRAAHEDLEARRSTGKLVLRIA